MEDNYCIIDNNGSLVIQGDLTTCISVFFNYQLTDYRLVVNVKQFPKVEYHSYKKDEWSLSEMVKDVNKFLMSKVKNYGANIFRRL